MKYFALSVLLLSTGLTLKSQNNYPEPEFSNEVYYLNKDSTLIVMRLEKGTSKMESKTKMGGFGGAEMGYAIDEERSTVRINERPAVSFVISTGAGQGSSSANHDSIMKANGLDASMGNGYSSMRDPANTVALYKAETTKGKRKIYMQKSGGAFGNKKTKTGDRYSFSTKKIREGYWELVMDKPLPKGEYMFTAMGAGMGNMDGSITLFAFGID
jgi:hypothetical protein